MSKIDMFSNYESTQFFLDSPLYNFNKKQTILKYKYFKALKNLEKTISTLKVRDRMNATFNGMAEMYVAHTINGLLLEQNYEEAFELINKETNRLVALNERYKKGNIEALEYNEMKNILMDYMKENEIDEELTRLYFGGETTKKNVR